MSAAGQVLCPGCLAPGPRLTGGCSTCGAQRQIRGRYWIDAVLGSRGPVRTLRGREGSSALGAADDERLVLIREIVLPRAHADEDAPQLTQTARRLIDVTPTIPGVPRLLEHFEALRGGLVHHYFVEAWIEGRALADDLAQGSQLDEASARAVAEDVLTTLAALHGHDPPILHGAIRPAHVLARADMSAGGPRHVLVALDLGFPSPTPGYTPFAQLLRGATPATDLHALGATLITLLTGTDAADLVDPETQRIEFEPHEDVSPTLARVLARMVSPRENERFSSATEVLGALADRAEPAASVTTPSPCPPRPPPPTRPSP